MSKAKPAARAATRPAANPTTPLAPPDRASAIATRARVPSKAVEIAQAKAAIKTQARPKPADDEGVERDLGKLIRVRATRTGFIDNVRRREGDVFDCHEAEFTDKWMEVVDGDTPTSITGPAQALKQIHDTALSGKLVTAADDPLGTGR